MLDLKKVLPQEQVEKLERLQRAADLLSRLEWDTLRARARRAKRTRLLGLGMAIAA